MSKNYTVLLKADAVPINNFDHFLNITASKFQVRYKVGIHYVERLTVKLTVRYLD